MTRRSILLAALLLTCSASGPPVVAQPLSSKIESLALATRARLMLANDEELRPYVIEVEAQGSSIRLAGQVASEEQWARAGLIVEKIPGVSSVRNELRLTDGSTPEDYDLIALDELEQHDIEALDPMMMLELEQDAQQEDSQMPPSAPEPETKVVYRIPEGYHLVEDGDTLLRISERYGITIRDIREYTNLSLTARPEPGQMLRVRPLGTSRR